jgi:hypothetical protein
MDFETFRSIILGGSIVTLKSDVLISNIHTVEDKWNGWLVGGEVLTVNWDNTITRVPRWTTIPN